MLEAFLIQPFFAVILVAISCSLLGVFVLWKKLFYFGDAMSHAILLGLVMGTFFNINQAIALASFAIFFALLTQILSQNRYFTKGLIVMILSYFCVAAAIIFNDLTLKDFNFSSYIFGDILSVGTLEISCLAIISAIVIFYTVLAFKKILLINLNEDLAKISGIKVELWKSSFLILLALTIAFSIQIIGIFLMTALLILPAALARIFSNSALQMLLISMITAVVISASSFLLASNYDLKVGSTIILSFCTIFILAATWKRCYEK